MASFWQDLRYNLRLLRLSPGFTLVAVLTLALGIGANTAIFQLISAIRLRSIPVKNPQELGTIRIADRHWGSGQFSSKYSQLSFPMWEEIRKRQEAFSEMAVWSNDQYNLATGGEVRFANGLRVSGDFFRVLGVQPALGRLLGPEDDQPGCPLPLRSWASPRPASTGLVLVTPLTSPSPFASNPSSIPATIALPCVTPGGSLRLDA